MKKLYLFLLIMCMSLTAYTQNGCWHCLKLLPFNVKAHNPCNECHSEFLLLNNEGNGFDACGLETECMFFYVTSLTLKIVGSIDTIFIDLNAIGAPVGIMFPERECEINIYDYQNGITYEAILTRVPNSTQVKIFMSRTALIMFPQSNKLVIPVSDWFGHI